MSDAGRSTVIGASGFIGRHLVSQLRSEGQDVLAPPRGSDLLFKENLGTVFYCAGLTADWRGRPLDAIHAHVGHLVEVLERSRFTALVYLSSTRVYKRATEAKEETVLAVSPTDPDDLFDLSKLLGEAACLSRSRRDRPIRVARISNVHGADFLSENFLSSVLRDAIAGRVALRTSLSSSKDYVAVEDVVALLPRIAASGREQVYNVASGANTTHGAIVSELARLTGCTVDVAEGAPTVTFPPIAVERARAELGFEPRPLLPELAGLVFHFQLPHDTLKRTP